MPSNIEIKARVIDIDALRKKVDAIATEAPRIIAQEDVFFSVNAGRLKLRIFSADHGELIYYERPNNSGPKESKYQIYNTDNPSLLRAILSSSLGEKVIVKKMRELFMIRETRVHLDLVESLGTFVEIEVVLREDQTPADGESIAVQLMEKLGISEKDLIPDAYADMILKNSS
ncbi:MAG: class IV adenylate cyclase [Planctomycetes bacterium]|nr:class IV adenylate cyclase [Planctomycetota bacterium]